VCVCVLRSRVMASRLPPMLQSFWKWTTREIPSHPRWSGPFLSDALLKCTVFAITGTSSMYFVRPALANLGLEGSWREGPNSYRIGSLFIMSPIYTCILLTVGTLAGQHRFFSKVAYRMWSRVLPKSALNRFILCAPARSAAAK